MTQYEKQVIIEALKFYAENKQEKYTTAAGLVYVFEAILNAPAGTIKI